MNRSPHGGRMAVALLVAVISATAANACSACGCTQTSDRLGKAPAGLEVRL